MTLPSDYLKAVQEDLFTIKRFLRDGRIVEAFEAVQQAEKQIKYSIDEIEKVTT